MKTPTTIAVPLAAQVEAAEAQARDFRQRRAQLQAGLADLRDELQASMRRSLGSGGTSPELKALRVKIVEGEALLDEADGMIADADHLVRNLHAQLAATRSEEEKAAHAAEVARLSAVAKAAIAELTTALETAGKAGGVAVVALAELEQVDRIVAARFAAEARHLDVKGPLLSRGWKVAEFLYGGFDWLIEPLLPGLPGLGSYPGVNIKGYLAARDAATPAAAGAQQ